VESSVTDFRRRNVSVGPRIDDQLFLACDSPTDYVLETLDRSWRAGTLSASVVLQRAGEALTERLLSHGRQVALTNS
jgi:hypothetical protein